jgi:triphosphatase
MPMSQPAEIELKLDLPASQLAGLERLSLLKDAAPDKEKTLLSVYYDTDKQKLRKNGLSLRVRRTKGHHVQTIKKRRGRSAGLFERNEWESDLVGRQPDFDAAHGTALGPLLNGKLRRDLKPVFETRVRRKVYPIRRDGSAIELSVDKGKVEAAGQSSPLCEIELELKDGEPAGLFEVAHELGQALPVRLASKSKAERGYELIGKEKPAPVKAEPIALTPDVNWATAFRIIARACLYQVVANEPALRRDDHEAVHQMRVGIRRLRTAISLFSDMLDGPQTEAMKSEFKWLAGELGPARELDVFITRVVKTAEQKDGKGSELGAVSQDFRSRRELALAKAAQAVASERFRRLVLDAAAWIEIGDWTHNDDEFVASLRQRPVTDAAAQELRRRNKKIRKQGARLAKLDPRQRHKLRIGAKKLRYATEFFAGAFPGKKSERRRRKFAVKLKKLQGALGDLNDIMVHEGLAKRSIATDAAGAQGRRVRKAFAVGRLSGREEAGFAAIMKGAEQAYDKLAAAALFWS